jgi:nucleoside 2-deoxyribosyltransferase
MPKSAPHRPKLYLAGPDVFLADAIAVGRVKCELAALAGFDGLYPLDNVLDLRAHTRPDQGAIISKANEDLMRLSDGAIANLTPFRGVSMDAGTAFEVGFMRALGRPVFGYSNVAANYRTRAMSYRARGIPDGDYDRADLDIEDFELAENLMIDCVVRAAQGPVTVPQGATQIDPHGLDGFKICLEHARRYFFASAK